LERCSIRVQLKSISVQQSDYWGATDRCQGESITFHEILLSSL